MWILGQEVQHPPTTRNYTKTCFPIGLSRRTLTGAIDVHVRATKKRWTFTLPEQGLAETLALYLDGTPFLFKDIDDLEYTVVLMGAIVTPGYPSVSEMTITLEQV